MQKLVRSVGPTDVPWLRPAACGQGGREGKLSTVLGSEMFRVCNWATSRTCFLSKDALPKP